MDKRKMLLSAAVAGLIAAGGMTHSLPAFADDAAGGDAAKPADSGATGGDATKADKAKCKGSKKKHKNHCKGKSKNGCNGKGGCNAKKSSGGDAGAGAPAGGGDAPAKTE